LADGVLHRKEMELVKECNIVMALILGVQKASWLHLLDKIQAEGLKLVLQEAIIHDYYDSMDSKFHKPQLSTEESI
jgi:hypothetical protein